MGLHRIVNGKKVNCSKKEEADIRKEWKENKFFQDAKDVIKRKEEKKKKLILEGVRERLGLSVEEIELLISGK